MGNGNLPTSSNAATTSSVPNGVPTPANWILGAAFMRGVYTVFRAGTNGSQPAVGFAPIKGVNYTTDWTHTIGVSGDGVNGRIGQAGVTIIGTAQPTPAPDSTSTGSGSRSSNGLTNFANAQTSMRSSAGPVVSALGSYLIWAIMLVIGCAVNW
jgi:hypothetical protein